VWAALIQYLMPETTRLLMNSLIYLLIGLGAGVAGGLFGIGGGVVIVPALVLIARMTQVTAVGTSLGALLLPVGIFGAWQYWRNGHLDVRASAFIAVGLAAGIFLGATVAQGLSSDVLRRAFAVFLVVVAVRMWVITG
jgi:uncharacterized membrane protein YfcA